MRTALRRIARDLKNRRHVESYGNAGIPMVFAALSIVGDRLPEGLR